MELREGMEPLVRVALFFMRWSAWQNLTHLMDNMQTRRVMSYPTRGVSRKRAAMTCVRSPVAALLTCHGVFSFFSQMMPTTCTLSSTKPDEEETHGWSQASRRGFQGAVQPSSNYRVRSSACQRAKAVDRSQQRASHAGGGPMTSDCTRRRRWGYGSVVDLLVPLPVVFFLLCSIRVCV